MTSEKTPILDHGYLQLIERWGSDQSVIEGARMSTDKGFLGWGPYWRCTRALCDWTTKGVPGDIPPAGYTRATPCPKCGATEITSVEGDEKLLKYLWEHKHATPFEMAGLIIEVQAPLFVFREWHRHRTQSYNELSARYTPMPDLNYVPTIDRLLANSGGTNKQAGTVAGSESLNKVTAGEIQYQIAKFYEHAEELYQKALAAGTPKELARLVIPVGRYSRMRASANLRNWLAFLTLRNDPAAQYEIRVFAQEVANIIQREFPRTHEIVYGAR